MWRYRCHSTNTPITTQPMRPRHHLPLRVSECNPRQNPNTLRLGKCPRNQQPLRLSLHTKAAHFQQDSTVSSVITDVCAPINKQQAPFDSSGDKSGVGAQQIYVFLHCLQTRSIRYPDVQCFEEYAFEGSGIPPKHSPALSPAEHHSCSTERAFAGATRLCAAEEGAKGGRKNKCTLDRESGPAEVDLPSSTGRILGHTVLSGILPAHDTSSKQRLCLQRLARLLHKYLAMMTRFLSVNFTFNKGVTMGDRPGESDANKIYIWYFFHTFQTGGSLKISENASRGMQSEDLNNGTMIRRLKEYFSLRKKKHLTYADFCLSETTVFSNN